ncbi:hypothetical protein [Clostridium ljungdahlii]|uniref:Uncharacterized protein n=1 Tax=Clostridium ljungdahlii TaxID=1538 RepID=A0A162L3S4_9CLOT|nr:hypothetical protein [Clostridium ljungdahlii]OAA90732.1 hypothetical protein WY13_01036 [Clostridium ljungdahlii]
MNYYWAKFKKLNNNIFRFDTRIYLNLVENPSDNDLCIGGVVGKNPGSALPYYYDSNNLQKIDLNGDKLLPNVRSIFLKAYKYSNKTIYKNSYIQVLNLIYICDKDLSQATKRIEEYSKIIICDAESKHFPFLWYVWGGYNEKLNIYKQRFCNLNIGLNFYFSTKNKKIINSVPGLKDAARHTQGLKHKLVIPYISNII